MYATGIVLRVWTHYTPGQSCDDSETVALTVCLGLLELEALAFYTHPIRDRSAPDRTSRCLDESHRQLKNHYNRIMEMEDTRRKAQRKNTCWLPIAVPQYSRLDTYWNRHFAGQDKFHVRERFQKI